MAAFDFETNIESAAIEFLSDATGLSVDSFYASLEQDNLVLPRISVRCEIGGAEDPPTATSAGDLEYSQYEATLSIIISSDASIDGTHTSHRDYREKARRAMFLNADNWTTTTGNIVVSGAGSTIVNGVYEPDGEENERTFYSLGQSASIRWSVNKWLIRDEDAEEDRYDNFSDVATPDLATGICDIVESASLPLPTVTAETILPDYEVKYMRPSGTDFETDGDLAISTLTYELKFTINPDSY